MALCFFCINAWAVTKKSLVWTASASGSSGNSYVTGLRNADNGDGSDAFQGSDGNYYFNTGAAGSWKWDRYMKISSEAFANIAMAEGDKIVISLNYHEGTSQIALKQPNGSALFENCTALASGEANRSSYSLTLTSTSLKAIQQNGLLVGGINLNWNEIAVVPGDYKEPEVTEQLEKPGFYTEGTKLLDANGKQFVMRGYNYSYAWQKDYWGAAFSTAAKYHCNALRIQLSDGQKSLGGTNSESEVASLIQSCRDNKFIGVFNVQDTGGGNDPNVLLHAADFWIGIKNAVIGQEKYCIVNIGNEWMENPVRYSNGEWGEYQENLWSETYIQAVRKMRNAGIKNTIMIDCNGYGQYADIIWKEGARILEEDARHFKDGKPNIIFSIHFYEKACYWDYEAGTGSRIAYSIDKALSVGAPLCIGEYAYSRKSEQWKMDWQTIQDYSKTMNVGYLGWSFTGNGDAESQGLDMFSSDGNTMYKNGECIINHPNDGIWATSKTCSVYDGGEDGQLTKPYVFGGATSTDAKYFQDADGKALEYAKLNIPEAQLTLNTTEGLTLKGADLKRAGALEGRFFRLIFQSGTTTTNGQTENLNGPVYAATANISYGSLKTGDRSLSEWKYLDIPCDANNSDLVIKGSHCQLEGIYLMKPEYLYKSGQAESELKATYTLPNNGQNYTFKSGSTWGIELHVPGSFFQNVQEGWTMAITYKDANNGQISVKDGNHYSTATAENGVYYSWLQGSDSYNGTVDYSSITGSGTWTISLSDQAYKFKDYKTSDGMATGMLTHLKSEGLRINGHDWTITGISLYGPKATETASTDLKGCIEAKRHLAAGIWRPVSFPYNLNKEQMVQFLGANTKVTTLTEVTRDDATKVLSVNFEPVDEIRANQGYLVKADEDKTALTLTGVLNNVEKFESKAVTINGVSLVSTAPAADGNEFTTLPVGSYYLRDNVFYPSKSGGMPIKAGLCYLTLTSEAQAKGYSLFWNEETTGIHQVPNEAEINPSQKQTYYYTLQGVRVLHPTKGIYIKDGKKVIVN